MKVSLLFYPNELRTNKKTGKVPIYLRLLLDRKKSEMRLNVEVKKEDLRKWDSETMRFREKKNNANAVLNKIESKFEEFQYHSALTLANYDVKEVRNILMGVEQKPQIGAFEFAERYYMCTVETNQELTEGTKKNYRKAINHLKKFLQYKSIRSPAFKEITVALALDFKDYLLSPIPALEKIALKEPSAFDIVKKLRTIFDRALDEQLLPLNPFKKIKLKSKSSKKGWLDIHQVKQIADADLTHFARQQLYRDLFLFSIFTGLSYSDTQLLSADNLSYRADGNVKLLRRRTKTDVITEMFLPIQAIAILNKYKDFSEIQITGKLLPARSNKEVNVQVKILGSICKIPLTLTTHIARHSFRQLLAEADIIEMAVIKRMMGHSRNSDIDNIYYTVTEARLLEAKKKFESFLNKYLV